MYDLESTTLAQRITLCCLVDLSEAGQTPANAAEIKAVARGLLEAADGEPIGSLSDADVVRSLSQLADSELIDERRPEDRSPVGKGRPKYALDADAVRLKEQLEADGDVRDILD